MWTQVDKSGHKTIQLDKSGYKWTHTDKRAHKGQIGQNGYTRTQEDTN